MPESTDVLCPTCKANVAMRVNRNGFLQQNVLSHFGIYPWKCGACGSTFLCRRRGQRSRTDGRESESNAGPSQRRA
jgi:hypothetical protein